MKGVEIFMSKVLFVVLIYLSSLVFIREFKKHNQLNSPDVYTITFRKTGFLGASDVLCKKSILSFNDKHVNIDQSIERVFYNTFSILKKEETFP